MPSSERVRSNDITPEKIHPRREMIVFGILGIKRNIRETTVKSKEIRGSKQRDRGGSKIGSNEGVQRGVEAERIQSRGPKGIINHKRFFFKNTKY
jgi:hypothetical protein